MAGIPPPYDSIDVDDLGLDSESVPEAAIAPLLSFLDDTLLNDSRDLCHNLSDPQHPFELPAHATDSPSVILCSHGIDPFESEAASATAAPDKALQSSRPTFPERNRFSAAQEADLATRRARVREKNRRGQKAFRERKKARSEYYIARPVSYICVGSSQTSHSRFAQSLRAGPYRALHTRSSQELESQSNSILHTSRLMQVLGRSASVMLPKPVTACALL